MHSLDVYKRQVLVVNNGELAVGCPTVAGATVTGTVVKEGKAKKEMCIRDRDRRGPAGALIRIVPDSGKGSG